MDKDHRERNLNSPGRVVGRGGDGAVRVGLARGEGLVGGRRRRGSDVAKVQIPIGTPDVVRRVLRHWRVGPRLPRSRLVA